MRKLIVLLAAVAIWSASFAVESPATRHVGIWAHEDDSVYVGVSLREDGVCKMIFVVKRDVGARLQLQVRCEAQRHPHN